MLNPAHSANLNPIENIWTILKNTLALKCPKTRFELEKSANEAWNSLSQDVIIRVIDKLKNRICLSVIQNGGDWI